MIVQHMKVDGKPIHKIELDETKYEHIEVRTASGRFRLTEKNGALDIMTVPDPGENFGAIYVEPQSSNCVQIGVFEA